MMEELECRMGVFWMKRIVEDVTLSLFHHSETEAVNGADP